MRYIDLFSGVGSFIKAMSNLNINYELVAFSEIDKWAIESYTTLHNINKDLNLGDITKISNYVELDNIDLITHGSPCQDFSEAGTRLGGDKNSGTRSSLMWYTVDAIKSIRPKHVIWENVKGVLYKNHIHNFNAYLSKLSEFGYMNQYFVLNAKDYGVPQNRERVFVISSLKEYYKPIYPEIHVSYAKLEDYLDTSVNDSYYLDQKLIDRLLVFCNFDSVSLYDVFASRGRYNKKYQKNIQRLEKNKHGYANTLTSVIKDNIVYDGDYRYLTPREYWRLMGFEDKDYNIIKHIPTTQLYKQASNAIVVPVIEAILKELF